MANALSLKQFFEENPPTLFLLHGCTIAGCIHTDYGEALAAQIPKEQVETIAWQDVDFKAESMFKSGKRRDNSIQEHMMKRVGRSRREHRIQR